MSTAMASSIATRCFGCAVARLSVRGRRLDSWRRKATTMTTRILVPEFKKDMAIRRSAISIGVPLSRRSINDRRMYSVSSATAGAAAGVEPEAGGGAGGEGVGNEKERELTQKLIKALSAEKVVVEDASGGCGTMYNIYVKSSSFQGKSLVQQHRMVTEALETDVKGWHGLTVRTAVSKPNE